MFGTNQFTLNAVNFAVHFAERSSASPVFVRFVRDMTGNMPAENQQTRNIERKIQELTQDFVVREADCSGDVFDLHEYELEIRRFVEMYDISEIIMSAPGHDQDIYPVFLEHVESLKQTTNCRIITVKDLNKGC
ncbi:MAG: hypothetical protein ACOCPN_01430 [Desulfonatronovibrionaceae bacterium]